MISTRIQYQIPSCRALSPSLYSRSRVSTSPLSCMAPGTPIAGDATTDDGSGSNHRRWPETSKVYTRKIKNPKTNPQPQPPPPPPPPALSPPKPPPSAADDITPSEPPPPLDGVTPASPPGDASNLSGHQREEEEEDGGTIKVDLRSSSEDEIRVLRRKFTDELEQVRALSRKIESCFDGGGGAAGDFAQSQPSAAPEANGCGEGEGFENEEREPNYCQLNGNCVVEGFEEEEQAPAPDYCHLKGNGVINSFEKEERLAPDYRQLNGNGMIEGFETEERTQAPNHHHLNCNSVVLGFEKEERMLNYHHVNGNGLIGCFTKEERTPKYRQLSVCVAPETNRGMIEGGFEKEKKRTPKANQLYKNSDFILIGNDKFPPELNGGGNKKMKPNGRPNSFVEKRYARAFMSCATLLGRLMKHKFGWVFNTPVDVMGLGLHDYYSIIKHPMDLGTAKSRLNKNWYKSPGEFAEDVRLTFHNAMTYNPKGQDVHIMAQQLLQIFEERWPAIEAEYTYVPYPPTPVARKPPPIDVRMLERNPVAMETKTKPVNYPVPTPTSVGRPPVSRQPKPKAKDLYKREMTWEEKQKLSGHLQDLPPAKLDGVVQIIRKRNSALCRQEDEIEIDIDLVDTESLWELDRFVTNYKKSLSKHKRKAEIALAKAAAERERGQEKAMELGVAGDLRENTTVVDGIEQKFSFPVGGENKRVNSSGSSSSSTDSGSSSSDSDSDSSSASDAVH